MSIKYVNEQPAGFKNRIERVAIVGAGGTVGKYIAEELLKTGKHAVTALSRPESKSKLADGIKVVTIDYDNEASIVNALQGQEFLIITMSVMAPRDNHSKLVQAAAKAGVPYVMPNWYGGNYRDEELCNGTVLGAAWADKRKEIERLGLQWIALCCGFWYEYSLASGEFSFGFDLDKRSLTLYDDGTVKNTTSTWEQCGRAVAAVLSLNVLPENESDKSLTAAKFLNGPIYTESFTISQKDMYESVKRVTGTADADWTITHEPAKTRYEDGAAQFKAGNPMGFGKMLYARAFFKESANEFSDLSHNELLGLPKEVLDERTKIAIAKAPELKRG